MVPEPVEAGRRDHRIAGERRRPSELAEFPGGHPEPVAAFEVPRIHANRTVVAEVEQAFVDPVHVPVLPVAKEDSGSREMWAGNDISRNVRVGGRQ